MASNPENSQPESQQPKVALSPPWFRLQRLLSFTVGQSSLVMVSELIGDGPDYSINVVTFKGENAQSLANVVKSSFSLGNINVSVTISDIDGKKYPPTARTPSVEDLKRALLNNPLVYDVAEKQIVCQPVVVQFWNDDISHPDGVTFMLASDGFNEIVVDVVRAHMIGKKLPNT